MHCHKTCYNSFILILVVFLGQGYGRQPSQVSYRGRLEKRKYLGNLFFLQYLENLFLTHVF
jgi:hypothetical protein